MKVCLLMERVKSQTQKRKMLQTEAVGKQVPSTTTSERFCGLKPSLLQRLASSRADGNNRTGNYSIKCPVPSRHPPSSFPLSSLEPAEGPGRVREQSGLSVS